MSVPSRTRSTMIGRPCVIAVLLVRTSVAWISKGPGGRPRDHQRIIAPTGGFRSRRFERQVESSTLSGGAKQTECRVRVSRRSLDDRRPGSSPGSQTNFLSWILPQGS